VPGKHVSGALIWSSDRDRGNLAVPPTGSPEAIARPRFPQNADFPHYALQKMIHSTARACNSR
jgi:hypothetical protein